MKRICGKCCYWKHEKDFNKIKHSKENKGFCYVYPPELQQNIVPSIVRDKGLSNLREETELVQFRPVTKQKDLACQYFKKR